MSQQAQTLATARWKLGARATPYVFAFFMASIMAMLIPHTTEPSTWLRAVLGFRMRPAATSRRSPSSPGG